MSTEVSRREFLHVSASATAGLALAGPAASLLSAGEKEAKEPLFRISCTEYSLHRMIADKELDNLEYAEFVKKNFDLDAVEYWNRPFFSKAKDAAYLSEMKKRADDVGVKGLVILIDGEGNLGDPNKEKRIESVERHQKWVEAAKALGCHSIRVNAASSGSYDEQLELAADGLQRLSEFSKDLDMNVIVENHGGLSSNGKWLASVMKRVGMENCGTLPDFGNFGNYDRYQGVKETMPFAKSVSAKSHDFDEEGNETRTDYVKMMKIVIDNAPEAWTKLGRYVGIEYEGRRIPEVEGVKLTKALLERVREQMTREQQSS